MTVHRNRFLVNNNNNNNNNNNLFIYHSRDPSEWIQNLSIDYNNHGAK